MQYTNVGFGIKSLMKQVRVKLPIVFIFFAVYVAAVVHTETWVCGAMFRGYAAQFPTAGPRRNGTITIR
jgi:hypothetical protein